MKNSKLLGLLGLDKMIESLQKLLEVRLAMLKEEVEEKVAEKLSTFLPLIMVTAAVSLLILFCSLTLAFYLSDLIGGFVYGFGIVTLGYFLLTIVVFLIKDSKFLKKAFIDYIKK